MLCSANSSKRGMNGDIILRKVKLAPEEVASMINSMDCGKLDEFMLKTLFEFMPTDDEMKGLTNYLENAKSREKAVEEMTPCEQYMVAMKDLKDGEKKFRSLIFLREYQTKITELKSSVDHLNAACEELRTSEKFKNLLAMILTLVNKINTGGEKGPVAEGFTLDSLSKLSEVSIFQPSVPQIMALRYLTIAHPARIH